MTWVSLSLQIYCVLLTLNELHSIPMRFLQKLCISIFFLINYKKYLKSCVLTYNPSILETGVGESGGKRDENLKKN